VRDTNGRVLYQQGWDVTVFYAKNNRRPT